MQKTRLFLLSTIAIGGLSAGALGAGCTDEGEDDAAPSTSAGATTGNTASSASHGATSSSSGSGSSSSGAGGGGGAPAACLDDSVTAADFSIKTADLCPIAVYTAPAFEITAGGTVPTWGRHGGLLTLTVDSTVDGAEVHLERWSLAGTELDKTDTVITHVSEIPADGFPGTEAIDLPFQNLTAISWTGADFFSQGGVLFLSDTAVVDSHLATGVTGMAVLGTSTAARFLYTGLSSFGGPTDGTNALYYGDFADGTLGTSAAFDTWGEASGAVGTDADGHVIAINTSFSTNEQIAHGYAATTIAHGSRPAVGTPLLTLGGFGDALATLAPAGASPGLALYQPTSGTDFTQQDVTVLRYTVTADAIAAAGNETILQLTTADTNLTLTSDDAGHVWVGAPAAGGGATFYLLARP